MNMTTVQQGGKVAQSDCNEKESTLSLVPPQRLSEKVQLKNICQKYNIAILVKPGTYVK